MDVFITLLLAMAPISELRGAIPYAYVKGFSPIFSFIISIAGNMVPVIFLLLFLDVLVNKLKKYKFIDVILSKIFSHALKRSSLVEKYEAIGLALFVAIPLPVTGAWTGSIIAVLLKIKFKLALFSILLGVILAGIIVSLVCWGIIHLPSFIKK